MSDAWTDDMDAALVHHVNVTCQQLAIAAARLHPHEIYVTDEQLSNAMYTPLHGESSLVWHHPVNIRVAPADVIARVAPSCQCPCCIL